MFIGSDVMTTSPQLPVRVFRRQMCDYLYGLVACLLLMLLDCCRAEMREYCFPNSFNVTCARDEVIVMASARYGRMTRGQCLVAKVNVIFVVRRGQCLASDYQIGCWADVLHHVDRKCSGRRHCVIAIPDNVLHNLHPCQKDLLAYLESEHICQKVQTRPVFPPCQHVGSAQLTADDRPQFLASSIADDHGFGSSRCPWMIVAPRGRRVNVTLLDFAVSARFPDSADVCHVYARIRELPTGTGSVAGAGAAGDDLMPTEVTVCAGRSRERPVFVSESERVEVTLVTSKTNSDPAYFLLKYSAIGCADPVVPRGAWMRRNGEKATIACNFTTQTWHIVCQEDSWFGTVENCTVGLLIAVTIGLLLGVVLGVVLLALVMSCHNRFQRMKALPEHRAIYGESVRCVGIPPTHLETSYLCQPDTSSHYADHQGIYRYTHVCGHGVTSAGLRDGVIPALHNTVAYHGVVQ